jgi:hypothetical protein
MGWMSGWASQQARELGHHLFGGEHLLLALSQEPSIAREVLGELGVTHARLREALVSLGGSTLDPTFSEDSRAPRVRCSRPTKARRRVDRRPGEAGQPGDRRNDSGMTARASEASAVGL